MAKITLSIEGPTTTQSFSYLLPDQDIPDFYAANAARLGQVLGDDGQHRDRTEDEILEGYVETLVIGLKHSIEEHRLNKLIADNRDSLTVTMTKVDPA